MKNYKPKVLFEITLLKAREKELKSAVVDIANNRLVKNLTFERTINFKEESRIEEIAEYVQSELVKCQNRLREIKIEEKIEKEIEKEKRRSRRKIAKILRSEKQ